MESDGYVVDRRHDSKGKLILEREKWCREKAIDRVWNVESGSGWCKKALESLMIKRAVIYKLLNLNYMLNEVGIVCKSNIIEG